MKNELIYIFFTHNRPQILAASWHSLFANNKVRPDRVLVIDDGSKSDVKTALFNAQLNTSDVALDIFSIGKNVGYGIAAEFAFSILESYNPNYVFFIESDYVFAKNGLDQVMDIFKNNEYGKKAVAFSGYDNPDFYDKTKTDETFPRIIVEDCGSDNLNRYIMYKPFKQPTAFGEVELEFVSNSCGTMYFNWEMIRKIRKLFPTEYRIWTEKVTDKHKEKRLLNDGMMSHGISFLWTKYAKLTGLDTSKYAALLNIKPSVSNHINGAGINGYIVGEGQSFVSSPSWKVS